MCSPCLGHFEELCFIRETQETSLPSQNEFLSPRFPLTPWQETLVAELFCLCFHHIVLTVAAHWANLWEPWFSCADCVRVKKNHAMKKIVVSHLRNPGKLPFCILLFIADGFRLEILNRKIVLLCGVRTGIGQQELVTWAEMAQVCWALCWELGLGCGWS